MSRRNFNRIAVLYFPVWQCGPIVLILTYVSYCTFIFEKCIKNRALISIYVCFTSIINVNDRLSITRSILPFLVRDKWGQ